MLVLSRRLSAALGASCLAVALTSAALAPTALAAGPATVTVRVEGVTETKLPPTQVTTTTAPVVKDGNPADACSGPSAAGALELATAGNWGGPWSTGFGEYEIFSIEGESHPFEPGAPANYFWSFWLDEKESQVGACGAELQPGDRVLFFPSCFGLACPPNPELPLGVEAPASANVGEPVSVTVKKYSPGGEGAPLAGATVTGGAAAVSTDTGGHAGVTFTSPGLITLRATAPEAVRTETSVCVHNGNDGSCGTQAPGSPPSSAGGPTTSGVSGFVSHYTGPFALVAKAAGLVDGSVYPRGHAPRLLSGSILSHSAVSSVSLELRRRFRGRCYAYDGTVERFRKARCGTGSLFKVSSDGTFSYLLPEALRPGRYVLDIKAADVTGNRTTLARGTSRLVFYVR
jgi:hypothetical protein